MAKVANTAKASKSKAPAIHIGISDKDRAAIAERSVRTCWPTPTRCT